MNKITKLLSVFIIAGAIGTGVAGVAGCNKGGGSGSGGGSTCNHTYNNNGAYLSNGDGTHKMTCDICHEVTDEHANCTDADQNGYCDKCEAEMSGAASVSITINCASTVIAVENEKIELTATVSGSEDAPVWTIEGANSAHAEIVTESGKTYLKVKATATSGMTFTVKATVGTGSDAVSKTATVSVTAAPKYYELANSEDCIVDSADLLKTDATITAEPVNGTKGVYKYDSSSTVKIEGGVASATGGLYVDFGTTKEIIEVNAVLNVEKASGTGWTLFRLAGPVGEVKAKELFGIKTNGKYRINEANETTFNGNNYQNNADYEVTFLYNKSTKNLTVKLGQNQEITVYDGVVEFNGELTGFSIHTKAKVDGNDLIHLKKLAVVTKDLGVADYVAAIKDNVTTYNTEALKLKGDKGWTVAATESALSTAMTTANTALEAADTRDKADAAFNTYKTAVHTALANEYLEKLKADYPAENYNTGAGSKYDEAIAAATTALGQVTKLEDFTTVYKEHDGILKVLPDKEADKQESVVIELYLSDGSTETKIGTVNKNMDGAELKVGGLVKLSDLKTACTVSTAGKCVGKIYTDAARTTELEITTLADLKAKEEADKAESAGKAADAESGESGETAEPKKKVSVPVYTAVAGTEGVLKLYVTLGDAVSTSIDSALTAGGMAVTGGGETTSVTAVSNDKLGFEGTIAIGSGITGVFEANKVRVKSAALGGYTACYETGGKSKAGVNFIKLELTQACTITVKFADGKTNGGNCLGISETPKDISSILDSNKDFVDEKIEELEVLAYAKSTSGTDLATLTFSFIPVDGEETTTLYLLGSDSLLFYDITIGYEGAAPSASNS